MRPPSRRPGDLFNGRAAPPLRVNFSWLCGPGRLKVLTKTNMPARDLLQNPIWKGEELGRPIPASPHAVSVALPRWQDVVGYEEKKPEVVNALMSGYPRFFIHAEVRELAQQIGEGRPCLPFPSLRAARLCAGFIERGSGAKAKGGGFRGGRGGGANDAAT